MTDKDDIVRLFRNRALSFESEPGYYATAHALRSAADEIERLRYEKDILTEQFCRVAAEKEDFQAIIAEMKEALEKHNSFFKRLTEHFFDEMGTEIDGAEFQEWARLDGLAVEEKYDPEKHGSSIETEPGDPWFVPTNIAAIALNKANEVLGD